MSKTSVISSDTARQVAFGIFDKKDREIGARVRTYEVKVYDAEDFWVHGTGWLKPGYYFALETDSQRGGKNYGSGWQRKVFATAEERDAALEKYLAAAYKRAEKSFPWVV